MVAVVLDETREKDYAAGSDCLLLGPAGCGKSAMARHRGVEALLMISRFGSKRVLSISCMEGRERLHSVRLASSITPRFGLCRFRSRRTQKPSKAAAPQHPGSKASQTTAKKSLHLI